MTSFPFVVARGRSGTTLVRAILDAHPALAIPGESHFPIWFAMRARRYGTGDRFDRDRFVADLEGHWAFRRWDVPPPAVREAYEASRPDTLPDALRLAYATYARHHGKERYGDKTPSFVIHIDRLARLFPEARFVHVIRDGRDVALSYLDTDFGSTSVVEAAIDWDRYVRRGRASGARLGPGRYHELRYEQLVADPERVARDLCGFLGLTFDPEMLRYFERAETLHRSLSHREHHRNLYLPPTSGLRDWRRQMAPHDVEVFEAIAGPLLNELGYERGTPRLSLSARGRAARARAMVFAGRASGPFRSKRTWVNGWRRALPETKSVSAMRGGNP
jgi:hypothetical protein